MTKPRKDFGEPLGNYYYQEGYAAGLLAGEKRLARALRRWMKQTSYAGWKPNVEAWLTARAKRGKKK